MSPTESRVRCIPALLAGAALVACATPPAPPDAGSRPDLRAPSHEAGEALTRANYAAIDRLVGDESVRRALTGPIVVVVPVEPPSTGAGGVAGRLLAEQLAHRLTQHGLLVRHAGPGVDSAAEPGTGRPTGAAAEGAHAGLLATLARSGQGVWVGLKLVRWSDAALLSGWDYYLADHQATPFPAQPAVREVVVAPRHDSLFEAVRAYDRGRRP